MRSIGSRSFRWHAGLSTVLAAVGLQWVALGPAAAEWTAGTQMYEIVSDQGQIGAGPDYAWARGVPEWSAAIDTKHWREYTWNGGGQPQTVNTAFGLTTSATVVAGTGNAYSYASALGVTLNTNIPLDPDAKEHIGTLTLGPDGFVRVEGTASLFASANANSELRADAGINFYNP